MGTRLYVGNLPDDVRQEEVQRLFDRYGRLRAVDIKHARDGRGAAFAFIEFDHPRDAEDAVRARDNYDFGGMRMRVEFSKGGRVSTSSRGPPRRSQYRVRVTNMPPNSSWQDLKDHMRQAGDVGFSEVLRERDGAVGIVEYGNAEDFERAISKLDRTEMSSRFGERATVHVEEDRSGGGGGGSSAPPSRYDDDRRDDRHDGGRRDDRRYDDDRRGGYGGGGGGRYDDDRRGGGGGSRYDERPRERSPSRERERRDEPRYDERDRAPAAAGAPAEPEVPLH